MFTSEPQAVEVYQAGGWWPGELLGWRHAADGSCQVRVRVVLGGAEETAWTGLETLRLPERHLAMAPEPATAQSVARDLSVARHPSSRREHRVEGSPPTGAPTTSMPTVRDLSVVSDATVPPVGGRRRAPAVPAVVAPGGRRRAPEQPVVASSGGRRRAPETGTALQVVVPGPASSGEAATAAVPGTVAAGGRRRAPEELVAAPSRGRRRAPEAAEQTTSGPSALLGRHGGSPVGAPTSATTPPDAGRHRTADAGMLPAVSDATTTFRGTRRPAAPTAPGRGRKAPATRATVQPTPPATGGDSSADRWETPHGLEAEMLTRPMRLSDSRPSSRRPGLDGALRGV